MTTLESWNPLGILALLRSCEVRSLLVLVAAARPDVEHAIGEAGRLEHMLDKLARHSGLTKVEQARVAKLVIALHRARLADRVGRIHQLQEVSRRVLRTLGGAQRTDQEIQRWVEAIGVDTVNASEIDPPGHDAGPPPPPTYGGGEVSAARRKA